MLASAYLIRANKQNQVTDQHRFVRINFWKLIIRGNPRKSVADFLALMHESAPYKISSVHNAFARKSLTPAGLTAKPARQ
jgi:hypothetical protein